MRIPFFFENVEKIITGVDFIILVTHYALAELERS